MSVSDYIPVIGLEIHSELLTKSKVFCTCSAEFGGERNTRCCPVCSGMPGTLPVINQTAVEYAVRAGYALGCSINKFSVFDRKNYFYPDLPKAYQISQMPLPLCINGVVPIDYEENGEKKHKEIRINRIHLEEDAGKLIHDDLNGVSLCDYNRCGVPLIEIVTEPDMSSPEEARTLVETISLLLQYTGVSDCKMEQGSIRADVNVSLMRKGDTEFGTRAEIKNVNSLKSIYRTIEFEIKRQAQILDRGGKVVQETRRFDANRGETKSMRTKEDAHDYKYFPDPDILQVNFYDEDLERIKNSLPEMPKDRLAKYISWDIPEKEAMVIVNTKKISDLFEEAVKCYNNPKSLVNFINGEIMRRMNLGEIDIEKPMFTAAQVAKLVEMSDTDKVTKNDAKEIFREMAEKGGEPEDIAKREGMLIVSDTGKVLEVIEKVLAANEKAVNQYKGGDVKVFGFLMGQCNKELRGSATPKVVKEELEKKLKSL
ncbi:Asp-tRNA(Asn)/Glu-tRNA(Gln) amidotransferase subunit GatB [Huintestinicola butyrica]|uniref:Asp-tRNA(Asn)/Glu-tRNA(Gln) amidotransferase subunit GatB n=1 Tax=Huintestinicola butyrica TaxID=2981728 RepID=UPI003F7E8F00